MVEERAVQTPLEVGHRNGEFAEVTGGLAGGEEVVLHPSDRVSDGTFGICEECNGKIGVKRLTAIPFARFCIHCERRIEQQTTN